MELNEDKIKTLLDEMYDKMQNANGEEYNGLKDEFDKLQKNLDDLDSKVSKNFEKQDNPNKLYNQLKKADLTAKSNEFHVNAGTVLQPTYFGVEGGNGYFNPTFIESEIGKTPRRDVTIMDLISWGTSTSNVVEWYELSGRTDGAAMRQEGGKMGQSDASWIKFSSESKIISSYMKITAEALKDVGFLESEIRTELFENVTLALDTQLLSGDGSGNNIKGLTQYAPAFTAAEPWATGVTSPNLYDAILASIDQIVVAGNGKYVPNAIVMHPTDYHYSFSDLKISDGRYIEVPFRNGDSVYRVPVITKVGVGVGNILIGDFKKAKAFTVDQLAIKMYDQNEDDALYNIKTVTANQRVIFRVKNTDTGAFVYDAISDIKTAITAA